MFLLYFDTTKTMLHLIQIAIQISKSVLATSCQNCLDDFHPQHFYLANNGIKFYVTN